MLFDASFGPNEADAAWLVVFNADSRTLKKREAEFEETSYTRYLETSVRSGSRRLYTVVWLQVLNSESLKLPAGEIPVSGQADVRFQPLDDLMTTFMQEHNVAGGALAVSRNGRLVYNRGFGYSDVPCLLYTSPSPRDLSTSRMPSSA